MAGISTADYDPEQLRAGLGAWFAERNPDERLEVSPLTTNPSSGFSSQTFLFTVEPAFRAHGGTSGSLVLRLPPAGDGLFPVYDLERQARTQNALAASGVSTAAPATYEPDESWLGAHFVVMPRAPGRLPDDYRYCRRGWLHDAEPDQQRACCTAFADALAGLHRVPADLERWSFLARPQGEGLTGELEWWCDYHSWATDGSTDGPLDHAYAWARATAPHHEHLSVTWGDARFANAVFDAAGAIVALLDWEQAALGPAELDVGFWLATRRQAREVVGVTTDPELPGLLGRDESIARVEAALGRSLDHIAWHETFAMIRMGTCIVATQALLHRAGVHDHPFHAAQPLPPWARRVIDGYVT